MAEAAEGVVSLCALRRCGYLRASVSDGANVPCRSEVPVIVRFR